MELRVPVRTAIGHKPIKTIRFGGALANGGLYVGQSGKLSVIIANDYNETASASSHLGQFGACYRNRGCHRQRARHCDRQHDNLRHG